MKFPKYSVALYIEHNDHKTVYTTVTDWLEGMECPPEFKSPESRQRCIDTDSLWVMQWYPNTAIGSYSIAAPTLDELLAFGQQVQEELEAR